MSEIELVERLERLERAHRRLKGFALAALVLAATSMLAKQTKLAVTYAAEPVPNVITAHEFDVVDSLGKVRVSMDAGQSMPTIRLYDAQGKPKLQMLVSPFDSLPMIALNDAKGKESAQITVEPGGGPDIILFNPASEVLQMGARIHINQSGEPSIEILDAKGRAHLAVDPSGSPSSALSDPQGFEMDLGGTQTRKLVTGATEQTSAASIVMFGNDKEHHVVWKAP